MKIPSKNQENVFLKEKFATCLGSIVLWQFYVNWLKSSYGLMIANQPPSQI
jgi:hypothetical protein